MEIEKLITPRFRAILDLVPKCHTVADIGTDHAYIPVYLIKNNIADFAVAMDINSGPLKRAESTVKKFDVLEKIDLRLSDGLEKLENNEADVIVIAGMGGLLINEILDAKSKNHEKALFILQPMTAEEEVRKYLEENGFCILDERLAREDNKIYHILSVKKGKMKIENELNYYLGSKLFENRDENLGFAIDKLIKKYSTIIEGTKNAKNVPVEKVELSKRLLVLLKDELNKLK